MSKSFYNLCSSFYDIITQNKNYDEEVEFLDLIFRKRNVKKILEVGSTTGSHTLRLSNKGYDVLGIDFSEEMVKLLSKKIKKVNSQAKVKLENVLEMNYFEEFDAAISMFAMINQLGSIENTKKALVNIHRALKKRGLLVIDVPNIKIEKNKEKTKLIRTEENKKGKYTVFIEENYSKMNRKRNIQFTFIIEKEGKVQFKETDILETDILDYFEYSSILKKIGFKVLNVYESFRNEFKFHPLHSNEMILVCEKT